MTVLLSSCSLKDAVNKMSLELKRVAISGFSPAGFEAVVYMQVNNPNAFGLTISDLRYQVFINEAEVARSGIKGEIKIPANGSVVAELPITVTLDKVKGNLFDIMKGKADFRVRGEVVFKTWFGSYTLPYDTKKDKDKGTEGEDGAQEAK